MMRPTQLPLELGFRPALDMADFLVASCNETAVAWIDRWPNWPGPGLVVHGPAGSGKSHLVQVWAARTEAEIVTDSVVADRQTGDWSGRPIAIDNADGIAGNPTLERALLHAYNAIAGKGGHLLLTSRDPVARWPLGLPDLSSRLRSAASAEIRQPDDAVLAAVLVKQFADRQLTPGAAVISYLVPRMERSFAAIRSIVDQLDRTSLSLGKPISIAMARQALADRGGG